MKSEREKEKKRRVKAYIYIESVCFAFVGSQRVLLAFFPKVIFPFIYCMLLIAFGALTFLISNTSCIKYEMIRLKRNFSAQFGCHHTIFTSLEPNSRRRHCRRHCRRHSGATLILRGNV